MTSVWVETADVNMLIPNSPSFSSRPREPHFRFVLIFRLHLPPLPSLPLPPSDERRRFLLFAAPSASAARWRGRPLRFMAVGDVVIVDVGGGEEEEDEGGHFSFLIRRRPRVRFWAA